jgi:uncharacterized protein (DUF362 family)
MSSNSRVVVSKVFAKGDLKAAIEKAVTLIGGFPKFISFGDKVLIKANFNSPDRYPASADINFIRAVIALLREQGINDITLGASSGLAWQPTEKVLKKKKVFRLVQELLVKLANFDEGQWVNVPINGVYLKSVLITKAALEADKIIYLPNLKTHSLARFSIGLKLPVGFIAPFSRKMLHDEYLEEKLVEINLAVKPTLIILDARKCLVTGGPAKGRRKKANLILASTDLIALDVEGIKILKSFKAKNRLDLPTWELPQITAAKKLNLGVQSEADYEVLTG